MNTAELAQIETQQDVRLRYISPKMVGFRMLFLTSQVNTTMVSVCESRHSVSQDKKAPRRKASNLIQLQLVEPSIVRVALEETELTAEEAARFQESLDKQEAQPRFRFQLLPTR